MILDAACVVFVVTVTDKEASKLLEDSTMMVDHTVEMLPINIS
jgi:hypothetical protein